MSTSDVPELQTLLKRTDVAAHLMGCGSAGMRALAEYAADLGWSVSGCDAGLNERTRAKLEGAGVRTIGEHSAGHLSGSCELLVHTPAVSRSHPEIAAAQSRGIPVASYPQVLGAVSRIRPTIAVSGTHGKSTTTALIATALLEAQESGAVFCGAELLSQARHGWAGPGRWAVIEACEYRSHFLALKPEIGVVLTIEEDHFDCFETIEAAVDAYVAFAEAAKRLVIIDTDSPHGRLVAGAVRGGCDVESLSRKGDDADWTVADIHHGPARLEFDVLYRGRREDRVRVSLAGLHHVANVLAAYAALRATAAPREAMLVALRDFAGLGRRMESHKAWRGVRRIDDYAHHPTAVLATLAAVRQSLCQSGERMICLFQPHQISRTERFVEEFGCALSIADEAWVLPVYAAREAGLERAELLSRQVATKVNSPAQSRFIPSLDHALNTLETALRPGDVLVTLGAGDIDCLQYELPRRFP